ncbi:uncharacterized protein LOC128663325 [Bombina bombina]|uniref:uncharacterized protein LOC128663325 n=1 Tax=Bombina bombina TaxID=8345 RepID=UPI00235AAFB5|nr:uncharacterized protein LOC128663325 [Bombina bombina]
MGSLVSSIQCFCRRIYPMNARVVMLGLDGAGKTTILYRMKLNMTVCTIPTVGFNVETLDHVNGMCLTMWDIGLGAKGRQMLRPYLTNSHGLVFVVDSKDATRLKEAKETLFRLLEDDDTNMPLLVLANKQDLEGAHSPLEISVDLELEKVTYRKWDILGCCGSTGDGLLEAVERLSAMIREHEHKS